MFKRPLYIYFFLLLIIFVAVNKANAQLTYNELAVQYDSPWTFKKLQLIPIRFKDLGGNSGNAGNKMFGGRVMSFSDAMDKKKISVKEITSGGADVSMLQVTNKSKENILLMSGEMVQGGKQDRAFGQTTIIPSGKRKKTAVNVFCVEKGRWDDKERTFRHAGTADASVRKQIDVTKRQSKVWKQIDSELVEKNKKNQTSAYLKVYNDSTIDDTSYLRYFINKLKSSDSAYAGFIAITGNRIITSDIFAGSDICVAAYIENIKSYVHSLKPADGPPQKTHDEIKIFTDKFLPDKTTQQKYLATHGRMYYYNGSVIHLLAYD